MAQTHIKAPFKLKQLDVEQLRNGAVRPLFAVAGATELAVDLARGYATEAQRRAQTSALERFDAVQSRVAALSRVDYRDARGLQNQAREQVLARLDELTREARDAQARFEARIADLQKDARRFPGRFQAQVAEAVVELTTTYADLAARGEKFVAAIRKDGVKAVTAVKKAPSHSTVARREAQPSTGKSTSGSGSSGSSGSTGSTGSGSGSTAKKSTSKKSTARKSPAKKTAAKKSTAKKADAAKKSSTAKSTASKSTSTSSAAS